jgi:catechol 2,3-dioxygenase-like lactoylglutathione lyase family enzyme
VDGDTDDRGVGAMADEFSISLRYVALRTADLDRSRDFDEGLLGLNVCGEKPGEFLQFSVGDAAVCVDRAGGEEAPAAIFAVRGLDPLCRHLADAGVSVERSSEEGVGEYVVVHDPDGHELIFEPAEA